MARSLNSVIQQTYPAEFMEIIVADGMSTDQTRQVIQELMQSHPNLRMVDNPGKIVPTGLNATLRRACGEIIIRVDGHCEIATDYVQRCVEHIQTDQIEAVGGSIQTVGETPAAQLIATAMSSPFGVGDSTFRIMNGQTMLVDTIPFPCYTRKAMQQVGLYDEELVRNQDDEYNYRLREWGFKLLLAADINSKYYSRSSLQSLWRQYYQYGYWKVRVLQKHPRQMSARQFIPPAFVSALLGSLFLSLFSYAGSWLLGLILVMYLVTNLGASIWTAIRKDYPYKILTPIVFAILHISYGWGFLVGFIKFARRWNDRRGKAPAFKTDPELSSPAHPHE